MNIKRKLREIKNIVQNEGGLKKFYTNRRDSFLSGICLIIRFIFFLSFSFILLVFFERNKVELNMSIKVLETIITCLGIFIAIIITYFFSKLYSERSERIMRKQRIDEFSIKITAVRRIAALMKSQNEFWDKYKNLRYTLDTKNSYLTLPKFCNLDYDVMMELIKDIGEQPVQTYLSIKYLERPNNNPFNPFSLNNHRNYSLTELETMEYGCSVIWSFFDRNNSIFHWENIKSFYKEPMIRNLKILYPNINSYDNKLLTNVFSDIQSIIEEAYDLTYLNNISIIGVFGKVLYNILIFIGIILISIMLLNINTLETPFYTNVLLSVFIVNMIDFMINIYSGIKKDLHINEIYKTLD